MVVLIPGLTVNNEFNPTPDTKANQRAVILDTLRREPAGTLLFRELHGISHPAGRVLELRKAGHQISTLSRVIFDEKSRPHRSAVYVLVSP